MTERVVRIGSWSNEWRDFLGRGWQVHLAWMAVALFIAGATTPLADPDLPLHLATGEWILRHGFPFVEPWAWTRAGAPFQAYSWAIEALYFVLMSTFGPVALLLMHGATYVAVAGVMFILAREMEWSARTTLLMALTNVFVAVGATPFLRPQITLLIFMPLIWALVHRARDSETPTAAIAALVACSAVFANTHLLFPMSIAPCGMLLEAPPKNRARILVIPLAIVIGWFISPYALHWMDVFRLYFAPNALFKSPSPIHEYRPGFVVLATGENTSIVLALLFAVIPWISGSRMAPRQRLVNGALWLGGLVIFAVAVRSYVVWWLVILPACAATFALLPTPSLPSLRAAERTAIPVLLAVIALRYVDVAIDPAFRAGDAKSRYLPSSGARTIEPLAHWLDCSLKPGSGGRLVTEFNYGGYTPWRLPYLSESIDGRTIFPDSVAQPETYFLPITRSVPIQPWRTADVAIFPLAYPVAAILDTAAHWHRVAITAQLERPGKMVGLWVTDGWWARVGRTPLPTSLTPTFHIAEPRAAACSPTAQ